MRFPFRWALFARSLVHSKLYAMISNAPGGSAAVAIEELEKMHFMERRSCKTMWFKRWTGIWDSRLWFCEALFDAQEGDDPNRAELEPLRGHSVTQQDYCLDTTLTTANRLQFCCCASEDDDPLCEGAARCASVSIATLGCPGSRFKRPLAYRGSIHSGHDLTECISSCCDLRIGLILLAWSSEPFW